MDNSDGSIVISVNLNTNQAEKDLEKYKKNIEKTERELEETIKKREGAQQKSVFQAAELDEEKAKLQEIKDRLSDIRSMSKDKEIPLETRDDLKKQIPFVQQELADQQERVRMLQSEWNKTENSVERYSNKINEATTRLDAQKNEAGELVQQIELAKKKTNTMADSAKIVEEQTQKFSNRVKKLASRVFVFTMITAALRSLRTWFGNLLKTNSEFNASIAKLKGALLTLAQPLVEIIIPAVIKLINLLVKITAVAANIVSRIFGKTAKQSANAAKALNKQAESVDNVGSSASKAAKSLAGFDEINTLSKDQESSGGGEISGEIAPDFSGVIDEKLGAVETVVGGALLALGAILAFSGINIPLGITLMAAGALTLVSVIKDNWDAISQALRGPIGLITAIVGAALLVLGAILTFTGANIPLGIGLLIIGAAALATTVAVNWNTIITALQGRIGTITAIVSGALLVIGVILVFTGVGLPLGIGLIVAGAAGLATVVALNWNSIVLTVKNVFNSVIEWIQSHGFAMMILGIVLLFTGAAIPIGLALIALGVHGMVSGKDPLWNFILEKIKEVWKNIKSFWNQYIAPVFTSKFWSDLAKKCGNGLIAGFEGAINGIISLFETMINWIVSGLNKISFDVPDWVPLIGGKKFGFNIAKVKFGRVSIPRLATGAVIPPNREFMAVLGDQKHGTNIEAPLETIQEAVATVMNDMAGGMMAGFEALLEENRMLRSVVEGIEVGDSTIGQAAARYNSRMAIIKGGL